jgi:hypothetical protein
MLGVTSVTRRRWSDRATALVVASRIPRVRTPGLSRPAHPVPRRQSSPETDENRCGWALLLAWRRRRFARVRGRTSGRCEFAGALAICVVVASVLAACGSGSSGMKLTAYLVHGSQETGFTTQGNPSVETSLQSYVTSDYGASSDATTLKAEGFKGFADVNTGGPSGEQGGSFALELGSPSAAVHEQAASLTAAKQDQGGAKLVSFTVPGLPASTGIRALGSQSTSNVYWREGRCVLWVGDTASSGPVIAAARSIWGATHARKGVCGG